VKRARHSLSSAVVLVLALQVFSFAQTAATIEGVVLDAGTDQPLAGVLVTLATPQAPLSPFEARVPPPQTAF
jgi:hypothetical protein